MRGHTAHHVSCWNRRPHSTHPLYKSKCVYRDVKALTPPQRSATLQTMQVTLQYAAERQHCTVKPPPTRNPLQSWPKLWRTHHPPHNIMEVADLSARQHPAHQNSDSR